MVKIVSTHALLGDERTSEIYGWSDANPNMDERNKIDMKDEERVRRRVYRKRVKEKTNGISGEGRGVAGRAD